MEQPQIQKNPSEQVMSINSEEMPGDYIKTPQKQVEAINEGSGIGLTEMKDMSTKQKMINDIDIIRGEIMEGELDSTDIDHDFDEGDIVGNSPVKPKEEMSKIATKISLSWHDINIMAEPKPGFCGKKGVGENK